MVAMVGEFVIIKSNIYNSHSHPEPVEGCVILRV